MKKSTIVISVIVAVVVVSMVSIIVLALGDFGEISVGDGDVIAYIPLSGSIAEDQSASLLGGGAGITPAFVREQLQFANDDPAVGAIIFKLDSGGGAVGASQEIAEYVKDSEKPVVIFAGDMVASGAYYVSSQADKIVAKPGSLIGSIGVISQVSDLSGLYDKLGIKMQTIKSGKHKDMFQRTLTPEEEEKFQALSDEVYNQFVNDVARGRKLKKETVKELATGELFPATIAKKHGLVDVIGGYQAALDTAAKLAKIEDPIVEEYAAPTFFEEIFGAPGLYVRNLIRLKTLGGEFLLLEQLQASNGTPQYKHYGGK
ncbi:MAG: signal peptide peptidase SppA [Candidatus Aquicultor sp.]|nr:signal peptide peptidase SppA [Candidatus Aquicultor sp.]